MFYKDNKWGYEKEIRAIIESETKEILYTDFPKGKSSDRRYTYFQEFLEPKPCSKSDICKLLKITPKAVYMGVRISRENWEIIEKIQADQDFELFKMKTCSDRFGFDIIPIPRKS